MSKKFLASLAGLFTVASFVLALNGFNGSSSAVVDNTPDDDTVAIIRHGAFTEAELRTDAAKGDVPKVFSAFGISHSELNGFVNGIVWKDGRVTVGDKVVATGAITAGRWNNPTSDMTRIAGTDRAYKMSTKHFVDEGQTAFVRMINGQFSFAVIKSCGNPVSAKPTPKPPVPQPSYSCDSLRKTEINRTAYRFDATASADNGAKVTKYTFHFGDGKTYEIPTNGGKQAAVSHTYATAKTYTARVAVSVTVNGKTVEAPGKSCSVNVTVASPPVTPPKPAYACKSLNAALTNEENLIYKYTLSHTASGGAVLRDVDFDFGDDTTNDGVKPDELGDVTHSYAKPGTYTTVATLHLNVADGVRDAKCQVSITISPEVCPLDSSLPRDSSDCQPCPVAGKENLLEKSPDCVEAPPETPEEPETPEALPDTGPAELAAGGVGLSSIAGAGYYWRSSRRNLIKKLLNR